MVDNFAFPSINIFNPVHGGNPIPDPADNFVFDLREKWFGLYLQDQVELPFHLHLLAGLRYDSAEITTDNSFGGTRTVSSSRQSAVTPRVGLLWQPIKELAFYGNYVEGFGVPNIGALGVTGAPLKAETSQQWEAGVKTEFMDGRWTATLSYFDLTKQNVATGHPDPVLAALGFSVQTGEARNKGVELDVAGEVLPGLDVIATYTYTNSEITQMNDGTVGNRFPNVPKHAGSLWTTYRFQEPRLTGMESRGRAGGERGAGRESGKRLPDAGVCSRQPDGELYDACGAHATHRAIECGQSAWPGVLPEQRRLRSRSDRHRDSAFLPGIAEDGILAATPSVLARTSPVPAESAGTGGSGSACAAIALCCIREHLLLDKGMGVCVW
jgi:hypothetical protein